MKKQYNLFATAGLHVLASISPHAIQFDGFMTAGSAMFVYCDDVVKGNDCIVGFVCLRIIEF